MSSESESEEFFDAFDITPSKVEGSENVSLSRLEPKVASAFILLKKDELSTLKDNLIKDVSHNQNRVSHKSPWRSRTTSPHPDSHALSSLPSKLTSSLPTLHFQDSSHSHLQSQSSAQSLLMTLDKPFAKEENPIILMPPPKEIPAKFETLDPNSDDLEDVGSVCSGSLLDNLGSVEDDESRRKFSWRGRRGRQRKNKLNQDEEEEPFIPTGTPDESQSSSVDSFFPSSQTSAPFRVVEVDATSIYSTTFSQDKGTKLSLKLEEKGSVIVSSEDVSDIKTIPAKNDVGPEDNKIMVMEPLVPLSPEPDVVASTKANSLPRNDSVLKLHPPPPPPPPPPANVKPSSFVFPGSPKIFVEPPSVPVAPPRRNKRRRKKDEDSSSIFSAASLPSPSLAMACRDIEVISQHLDLQTASKGEYIVSPQDTEKSRAPGPFDYPLTRSESTGDTTSQASTPETSRSSCKSSPQRERTNQFQQSVSASSSSSHNTPSTESESNVTYLEGSNLIRTQLSHQEIKLESQGLTDEEILKLVSVLNLDTGERIPLSEAEECLPSTINPLSLHIMRLTSEYASSKAEDGEESDEESIADVSVRKLPEIDALAVKKKTIQLKKFLGKTMGSAVHKAKSFAQEVSHRNKEEKDVFEDDTPAQNTMQYVKIKTSHSHKGPHEFDNLMYVQELKGEHIGPVWCMKFSPCGRLLATAGQDHILRVWVLKQAFNYFLDIRTKWNADVKSSPTPSQESLVSQHSSHSSEDLGTLDPTDDGLAPFMPKPFCVYSGHTADVLDLSWSKNYFMLTSSMDKTVRLWHISRKECLCIFKHVDFVTAIAFHPKDDRYFISGSLDGKLRLWSIPDKQVVMWNEVEGHPKLITAANFCQNGVFTVVGTYNGRCIFYKTEELKYFTQIHVKSTRGKNARGRKITGIEPLPEKDMLLITSNDSRIRLYDLNVLTVACKYKGYSNISSQIRAGFSHDGKYIIAGSENQCIYIWKTHHDYSKFSSARKDRNIYWEGVKAHSAVVNCAIFSPRPDHVFNFIEQQETLNKTNNDDSVSPTSKGSSKETSTSNKGYVLVSADFNGCIKVFLKKEKPKHSSLPASALV